MSNFAAFGQELPASAIIGLIGDEQSGISEHLATLPPGAGLQVVDYTLDRHDALYRMQAARELSEARRRGATVLVASWNETLLQDLCDEVWWIENAAVVIKGDPVETLDRWRARIHARWRERQAGIAPVGASGFDGPARSRLVER
jgi:hypothetical protein